MRYRLLLLCFFLNTVVFAQVELSFPQQVFDSDTCCWRLLSRERRYNDAALLIVQYLEQNRSIRSKHALHWHAGQMFAMAGDAARAKKYFRKTYSVWYKWLGGEEGRAWYYYARGNVAFVSRHKRTLARMLHRWQKKAPPDKNYRKLQVMLERWDLSYERANAE